VSKQGPIVDTEYYQLMIEYNVAAMTAMGMYLTAASGYLVVAYLIGRQLTGLQTAIITCLFLWFNLFMAYGTYGYFSRAAYFYSLLEVPPPGVQMNALIIVTAVSLELVGIIACLKFMWDVRHPKKE
jgi:hypothetical protein